MENRNRRVAGADLMPTMSSIGSSDPLMRAADRLPVNPVFVPVVPDPPSGARPFVLRGVSPTPAGVVEAKHRTNATQRKIKQTTNIDNKEVDDSYTVPDD